MHIARNRLLNCFPKQPSDYRKKPRNLI